MPHPANSITADVEFPTKKVEKKGVNFAQAKKLFVKVAPIENEMIEIRFRTKNDGYWYAITVNKHAVSFMKRDFDGSAVWK